MSFSSSRLVLVSLGSVSVMLSACLHRLKTHSASQGRAALSSAGTSRSPSSLTRLQNGVVSTSRLTASSSNSTQITTSPVLFGVTAKRFYAKKKSKPAPKDEFDDSELDLIEEESFHGSGFKSLDSFFEGDQQVGETRIFHHPKSLLDEEGAEDQPEPLTSDAEEQYRLEQELRQKYGASEAEFEMAMGMSTYRPADRKSSHRMAKTVALNKIAKAGTLSFSDLADLDYDSLVRQSLLRCSISIFYR